ncbi:MAG TPA: AtpZ/AtpI family protein [Candidatus Binatia bacterium]
MINLPRSGRGEKEPEGGPGNSGVPFAKFAKYLAIGMEIPSTIVGSLILGYFIDRQFGTAPWVTVGASVLGFFGAVFRLTQYLKYFSQNK